MRRLSTIPLLLGTLALIATAAHPQSPNPVRPLSIEDALAMRTFPGLVQVRLSPDGKWVAYTLMDEQRAGEADSGRNHLGYTRTGVPHELNNCEIWITNTESGESKNLTPGRGTAWGPEWSPDGKQLAFISDRSGAPKLWVWERSSATLRQVSEAALRFAENQEQIRWAPDGGTVAVKLRPALPDDRSMPASTPGDQTGNRSTVTVFTYQPTAAAAADLEQDLKSTSLGDYGEKLTADLGSIEIATGRVTILARNVTTQWYEFSPDGGYLAFTAMKRYERPNTYQRWYDLVAVRVKTGQSQVVASNLQQILDPFVGWSPDGQTLAYVTYGPLATGAGFISSLRQDVFGPPLEVGQPGLGSLMNAPIWDRESRNLYFLVAGAIWRVSLKDRAAALVTASPADKIVTAILSASGDRHFFIPGESSLLITTRDRITMQEGIYRIELATGNSTRLMEHDLSFGKHPIFDVSADGRKLVYGSESAQQPMDLWLADAAGLQTRRRLTSANPQFDRYLMGASRLIEWKSADGQSLRGALLLPAGYQEGRRYPLVTEVYGGASLSTRVNQFGLWGTGIRNMQLLATRGYAVLLPDAPVKVGTPMQDLAKTVLPGIDKVIEMGIADPNRLGVMGESYGGYSALALIVQTTRFKAAIDYAGYGNIVSLYGSMDRDGSKNFAIAWNEEGRGSMGATLWEHRERYIENSPIFYLDQVKTPVLIVHGDQDFPFLADEIFICLRRLKKEVVYARYAGEGHGLVRYANQIDYCRRMISWFDDKLRPAEIKETGMNQSRGR
ncbi:MAG TPA: prolyl oligopeptidase family serine peptidase [Blastocatellia bacterium]|nr:prolyl oligopeptidase family serine peptidase [Blastocatellia bacterium]